jgi:hypothetical protein
MRYLLVGVTHVCSALPGRLSHASPSLEGTDNECQHELHDALAHLPRQTDIAELEGGAVT